MVSRVHEAGDARGVKRAISSEQRERSWRSGLFARVCVITDARRTTNMNSWRASVSLPQLEVGYKHDVTDFCATHQGQFFSIC